MGDIGIKIAKQGKDIYSTNPDDYTFWSKYKPLMLLGKRTDTVTMTANNLSGQVSFDHGFDFIPLPIIYIAVDGKPTYKVPFNYEGDTTRGAARWGNNGMYSTETIDAKINAEHLIFDWSAASWNPQEGILYPAIADYSYTLITYFYNLELGRILPD